MGTQRRKADHSAWSPGLIRGMTPEARRERRRTRDWAPPSHPELRCGWVVIGQILPDGGSCESLRALAKLGMPVGVDGLFLGVREHL